MARGSGRPYARAGRNQARGRGGRRPGRGAAAPRQRNGFKASRVQENEDVSESENSSQPETLSEHESIDDEQLTSEDEAAVPRQSYTALLQALKGDRANDEPARKRRKVEKSVNGGTEVSTIQNLAIKPEATETAAVDDAGAAVVEESEDSAERSSDGHDSEVSEDEDVVSHDPFEQHFASVDENVLTKSVAAQQKKQVQSTLLGPELKKQSMTYNGDINSPSAIKSVKDLHVKGRLQETGEDVFRSLSKEEKDLAAEATNYRDIHYGHRSLDNASRLRDLACLHALNHIFKTRDRVLKNNSKLSQSEGDEVLDLRDQGFTRPKVLFIVPTKQACVRFVESIARISDADQQENKSRFWEIYSQEDDETWENKPADFRELFGGNHEEDFRVGLKFTRKTIKYFSGFYNSDIIFGSALGLMRTITTGGGGKDKKKGHDADFLSSIEIVVVDHAAAIQMQNFQHLEYVFSQLNQIPKDSHGCDFARVRNWYLDGKAKHLRQTILFTAYHTPELNSLFSNHAHNIAGIAKYTPTYTGSMLSLPPSLSNITLPQTFLRFDSPTPHLDSDARFKFFTTTLLPPLLRHKLKGTLVFIPGYADFTRLRNHLSTSSETTSLSFGSLSEYTSVRDTARARSHFLNGRHSTLIYSERAHHHFRYRIKGVKRLVFYGVPENPLFWGEVVGFLGLNEDVADVDAGRGKAKGVVRALFSKWDVLKLERIVGTERVGRLVNDRGGDTFEFV